MEEKELLTKEIEELKKQKSKLEREIIINAIENENYHYKNLMEGNDVKDLKSILACAYNLKPFISLIKAVGFEKVNETFFEIWEEKQKKQEEGEEQE